MSSCSITVRQRSNGPRYVVRYRTGGRATPMVHAGSFKTLGEATLRRGLILDELAAGRDPALAIRALVESRETIPSEKREAPRKLTREQRIAALQKALRTKEE